MISENFRRLQNLKGPILLTGHTGFKGAWLSLLLEKFEIEHIGYSLPPEKYSLITRIFNGAPIPGEFGDIRNRESLQNCFRKYNPSAVIHLAAQPLVLKSFDDPIETFETNVMGTANVLQVASSFASVESVIVATTDKVYANNESGQFFKETDPLMGKDPYSSSKVGAESAVDAWRELSKVHDGPKIVSVRAGNVIGGGDWAENRLLPDVIRSFSKSEKLLIRNPNSVRPWQHVLDPLIGYLKVLSSSLNNENFDVRAVNFGPAGFGLSVQEVVEVAQHTWQESVQPEIQETNEAAKRESGILNLDSNFAQQEFGWEPNWNQHEAVKSTVLWWRDHLVNGIDAKTLCKKNIDELIEN